VAAARARDVIEGPSRIESWLTGWRPLVCRSRRNLTKRKDANRCGGMSDGYRQQERHHFARSRCLAPHSNCSIRPRSAAQRDRKWRSVLSGFFLPANPIWVGRICDQKAGARRSDALAGVVRPRRRQRIRCYPLSDCFSRVASFASSSASSLAIVSRFAGSVSVFKSRRKCLIFNSIIVRADGLTGSPTRREGTLFSTKRPARSQRVEEI
jgi:hypothetical protein